MARELEISDCGDGVLGERSCECGRRVGSAVGTADFLPHPRPRSTVRGGRAPKGADQDATSRASVNGMLPAVV